MRLTVEFPTAPVRRSHLTKNVIQTAIILVVLYVGLTAAWNTRQVQHRMKCSGTLIRIGVALSVYRGRYPDGSPTLDALVAHGLIQSSELVCPAARGRQANYQLAGPRDPVASDQALVYEPLANHRSGANVLFADGKCKFVPANEFKKLNLSAP